MRAFENSGRPQACSLHAAGCRVPWSQVIRDHGLSGILLPLLLDHIRLCGIYTGPGLTLQGKVETGLFAQSSR